MIAIRIGDDIIEGIEAVVFDKDGTLLDVHAYWYGMIRMRAELLCKRYALSDAHRRELMSAMGVDVDNERIKPEGPVGIKRREIVARAARDVLDRAGCKVTDEDVEDVFSDIDRVSHEHLRELIIPIEGAHELIERLKGVGCKIALATTDQAERAHLAMNHMNLDSMMDAVVGADHVQESKPAPFMIERIAAELDIEPTHMVMVGDAPADLLMGKNARMAASVGVESGLSCRETLLELTPYVIPSVADMEVT